MSPLINNSPKKCSLVIVFDNVLVKVTQQIQFKSNSPSVRPSEKIYCLKILFLQKSTKTIPCSYLGLVDSVTLGIVDCLVFGLTFLLLDHLTIHLLNVVVFQLTLKYNKLVKVKVSVLTTTKETQANLRAALVFACIPPPTPINC